MDVKGPAVADAGERIVVRLLAQGLRALRLLAEKRLKLSDHHVHGVDHPTQLGRFGQCRQVEKLPAADGNRLFDDVVQRTQAATQQQDHAQYAQRATADQPQKAGDGAVPQARQRKHRMADHFNACRLGPAAHHNGVTHSRIQRHQLHKPLGYAGALRGVAAFNNRFAGFNVDDPDTVKVAAVKNRVDHQFGHGRIVDMRG